AMFCAFTYWKLHDVWGITAWFAMPLVLLAAAFIGLVFERVFRPLAGQSAEMPIVVSLALLAVLQAGAVLLYGGTDEGAQSVFPTSTFSLGDRLYVGDDQVGTLAVSIAVGGFLWWLLRRTSFGTATRAVVDNRDLGGMLGINVAHVYRTSWALSSMFGALVGILLAPTQGLDINNLTLVVIFAFAPAVLGRLTSLPMAYLGALVLGIAQSLLSKWSSSGTVGNIEGALPYLALFVLLFILGGRLQELGSTFRPMAASNQRRRSPEIARGSLTRGRGSSLWLAAVAVVIALLVPVAVHGPWIGYLTGGAIFALIALTVVALTGWAGQISLAQFSFAGIGAFTVGHLAGSHGQHFLLAALVGMLISIPLSLIVGLPSLRLSGLYLALATMAFALLMDNLVFVRNDVTGGVTGLTAPRPDVFGLSLATPARMYELSVAVLAVACLLGLWVQRGPIGRQLQILRDSPIAASTLGSNLAVTKLAAFVVCGAVAALGGALLGSFQRVVTPANFSFGVSLQLLLLVVLSGRALIAGAVIAGALYMFEHLPGVPASVHNYVPLTIALGVIVLGRSPDGLVALLTGSGKTRVRALLQPRPAEVRRLGGPLAHDHQRLVRSDG
ncbi:MAG TPA: ABC transporter permease, partial [Mycobacteriales bacterium]|nr:ABC transporter permease [Mycobacteriales bacterium]